MVKIIRAGAATQADQVDGVENYSAVAGLADGGYVVVYNSGGGYVYSEAYKASVTYQDVFVERYNALGQLVSSFKVDQIDAPSRFLMKPDVVGLSGGGFTIAFMEESLDYYFESPRSGFYQEYARYRIYDADGTPKPLSFTGYSNQEYAPLAPRYFSEVTLAEGADGGFALSSHSTILKSAIYATDYFPSGSVDISTSIDTTVYDRQTSTAVASLSNGSIALIWTADGTDGDGSGAGVFMRLMNDAREVIIEKVQVNTNNFGGQADPDVTALSTGGFVVTWTSTESQSNYDIKAQRFNALGQRVGGEMIVETNSEPFNISSSVAAFDGGGFVAAWTSGSTVYAQRFLDNGVKDGGEIVVGDGAFSASPNVSTLASGGFVVSWTTDTDQDGDADIASRVFGPATEGTTATAATEVIYGTSGADRLLATPGAFRAGDQVDLLGGSDEA